MSRSGAGPTCRCRPVARSRLADVDRVARRRFAAIALLLFLTSSAVTVLGCRWMAAMDDMPMPGGWSLSMTWMPMPSQGWIGAALVFLGMWLVMMLAMMLPALAPLLWRYHQAAVHGGADRAGQRAVWLGVGYFLAWTAFGATVFIVGALLAQLAMQWPALARQLPIACGVLVLIAGLVQSSDWKARRLVCCRQPPQAGYAAQVGAVGTLCQGIHLGAQCVACCSGLTLLLLLAGVMDLLTMGLVTIAISVERLAPHGARWAKAIGAVVIGFGVLLIVRATVFA